MRGSRGKATMIVAAAPTSVAPDAPMPALVAGVLANVDVDAGAVSRNVVDFLDAGRWPTFDLGDAFLPTGVALVAVGPARTASGRARATEPTDRVSP